MGSFNEKTAFTTEKNWTMDKECLTIVLPLSLQLGILLSMSLIVTYFSSACDFTAIQSVVPILVFYKIFSDNEARLSLQASTNQIDFLGAILESQAIVGVENPRKTTITFIE